MYAQRKFVRVLLTCAFLLQVAPFPACAQVTVEKDIKGFYSLVRGRGCPRKIKFLKNAPALQGKEMRFSKMDCSTGMIVFRDAAKVSQRNRLADKLLLSKERIGSVIIGKVSKTIQCPGKAIEGLPIGVNSNLNLFKPKKEVIIDFNAVFGANSELSKSADGTYRFRRSIKYIIVDSKCIFKQASFAAVVSNGDPNSVDPLNVEKQWAWVGPLVCLGAVLALAGSLILASVVRKRNQRGALPRDISAGVLQFDDELSVPSNLAVRTQRSDKPSNRVLGPAPPDTSMSTVSSRSNLHGFSVPSTLSSRDAAFVPSSTNDPSSGSFSGPPGEHGFIPPYSEYR